MSIIPTRQVHLDFHTSGHIAGIGSRFDKKQFQNCLKIGHVSSITIFAKCHHGYAYFPSKTNTMHPGLDFDLTGAMLEACTEIGVEAPIYISAGFDENYAALNPQHLRLPTRTSTYPKTAFADGQPYILDETARYHELCMNSPYLDTLVSQVREVVERYDPIGIFLDIVSPKLCYCDYCRKNLVALGLEDTDKDFVKLAEFTYKKYYEAINEAARSVKPSVRIFHNGGHIKAGRRDLAHANTHLELESLPTGGWGYDHFPKSANYVKKLGMEYLGMTGKFHLSWGEFGGFKHPNALRYEAALSVACGAKCSVGDQMHPYAFLDEATYGLIGKAYKEVEEVEEYCFDSTSVADIALLCCEAMFKSYSRNNASDNGACRILLEEKYLFDVIDRECELDKYKLIIIPDDILIDAEMEKKLKAFVAAGGKLLCSGTSGCNDQGELIFDLGARILGKSEYNPTYYHPDYDALGLPSTSYIMYSTLYNVAPLENSKVLGYSRNTFFNRAPEHFCSHKHTPYVLEDNAPAVTIGKDGGYIAYRIFDEYATVGSIILKDTVKRVIEELIGDKLTVKTNLPTQARVFLNEQEDKNRSILHLLFAIPVKRGSNVEIIEDLNEICNVNVSLNDKRQAKSVTLVPEMTKLPFEYKDGKLCFTVDRFTCKQVICIDWMD